MREIFAHSAQQHQRWLADQMQHKLAQRLLNRALERPIGVKWKHRAYALLYGASLRYVLTGRCLPK